MERRRRRGKGLDAKTGKTLVAVDPRYFRPTEVDLLLGDPGKAKRVLGWSASVGFEEMVREMMRSDIRLVAREAAYRQLDEDVWQAAS